MSEEKLLSVENLTTQFVTEEGTVRAVDGISFDVYRGEIVGLVGESGAGKSVAIMSVMRLIDSPGEIVSGRITYKGETLLDRTLSDSGEVVDSDDAYTEREMRKRIRGKEIALIMQDPMESLNPVFKIGDQLREFIVENRDLTKEAAETEAIRMLREVGIPESKKRYHDYPHQFSGGMRQRVLIAMALACEPDLIIADEPTTALDVTVEGQILGLVDRLQREYDTSFIWVTHDLAVVAEICDRVNVMYLGEIIERASVDDIYYSTEHPYTEALLESIPKPHVTDETFTTIRGVMPDASNPPSGCRFHPRCRDAREVCTRVHPDLREVELGHASACLKHERFDADYENSSPIVNEATEGDHRDERRTERGDARGN